MADENGEEGNECLDFKNTRKLIIIGAGISGITTGNYLSRAGFTDFVIVEATDRIGGRICTVDLDTCVGRKAELGANWIHGIDANPIYGICMRNNFLSERYQGRKLGEKMMFMRGNGDPVNTKIVKEVDFTYGMLMSQCEDFYQMQMPTPLENDSVGAFMMREFDAKFSRYHGEDYRIRRMIFEHRLLGECVITGSHNMDEVALSEVGSFQELPGIHYVIPPGFESVVQILKKEIPEENILLEHPVTRVTWEGNANDAPAGVCVECQNGKKNRLDHVLVTSSLGYLKKHSARLFSPPLPDSKIDAINRVAMGTVNKVILECAGQVLPDGVFRLELIWDRSNMDNEDLEHCWFKKIRSFEAVADTVLMGWLSGREAEYMETLPEEEVGKTVWNMLNTVLKKTVREVPPLKKCTRSTWKTDPYSLGSYSFIGIGAYSEDIETLAEPVLDQDDRPVVLFAGEATHPTFYSSAHGALLSGEREAQRILDLCGH